MSNQKIPTSLKAYAAENKDSVTRGDGFKIDPRTIYVRPNFNVRNLTELSDTERAAYDTYVDELAKAYAAGRVVPPMTVRIVDGRPSLSDGHTRLQGALRAINTYGADLSRLEVNKFDGDDAEEVAFIATSNNNRKLRPLELALVYVRMERFGKSNDEIATIMGKSVPHVIQTKSYHLMPAALKSLVNYDKIAVATAFDLFGKHGTKAVEIAQDLIAKAESKGKAKVTDKLATPSLSRKESRQLNTATASLYSAIKDIELPEAGGEVTITLSAELLAKLKELGAKTHAIETYSPDSLKGETEVEAPQVEAPAEVQCELNYEIAA